MGNAARHREREPEPPPDDAAAVIAELRRIGVETDEIIARMKRIDGGPQLVVESISLAAHWAEARERMEALEARLPTLAQAHRMGMGDGRRDAEREAAERAAAAEQPRRRGSHRKRGLTLVTGTAAAASLVAASAGATIAAQDSASVRPAAAAASHAAFRQMPPDSAAPVPSWSPSAGSSAKPSVAVRSARPAPSVTVVPASSSPAPAPPSSPAPSPSPAPVLDVQRDLDLGASILGDLPLTAEGTGEVQWTATATDGITLSSYAGVIVPGQTVEIRVTDGPAHGGMIYISAGPRTFPVRVTTDLGGPVALP